MNPKTILCLVLAGLNLSAQARITRSWSDAELLKASDLVVVGQPIGTKDLDETNSLGWAQLASFQPRFRGVETTFKVSNVLKGMPDNDRVVLHHYRQEADWGSPPNGPDFLRFAPNDTNKLTLYLIKDGAGRYTPVTGQNDPSSSFKSPLTKSFGFPLLPPIADANPSIPLPLRVQVPARLKVERRIDMLSVEIDNQSSFEATNLMVGTNMVTGVRSELYIYPAGELRPSKWLNSGLGGTDFNLGTSFFHTSQDGFPLPGKKYVVELDLIVFETDIPPQHEWRPQGSKNFKVLWQRTLKQTVE